MPDAPAPAQGTRKQELPPPPGKDYAAKKAADDARHAPVEVDRLLGELGHKFGKALGEAEAELTSLKATPLPGMTSGFELLRRSADPSERAYAASILDAHQANLARKLNALPEIPTYADPTLAAIAQKAFERGFGAGVTEAKVRGAALDLALTVVHSLIPPTALAVEQAGAAALRVALTRFRGMPLFVPTAVGGGGVFLRVPKGACRSLTAADMGLPEGAIVEGTFAVRGGKATAYIKYLGRPEGKADLGRSLLTARASLKGVARAEGATRLRIETSPIIEPTNRLGPALGRAGFEPRPNGTMWWEGDL